MTTAAVMERPLFTSFRFSPAERQVFEKKEDITVSAFAEKHRNVNIGAHRGPWRNDISPHLTMIMDTWQLPHVREVVICKSPQTGGTETQYNCAAFALDHDPSVMMFIMPSELDARKVATDRIIPMITESGKLSELMTTNPDDIASRRIKLINGGLIYMAWSNSSSALATFPVKYLFFDEVDKYPPFVGKEADPITLGEKRARTFRYTYKIFKVSTPTREDGPIWQSMQKTDVLYKYHAVCPFCKASQIMTFSNIKIVIPGSNRDSGISQKDSGQANSRSDGAAGMTAPAGMTEENKPAPEDIRREALGRYVCEACAEQWTDADRDKAVRAGDWHRTKGEGHSRPRSVGFHLPSFISPDVSLSEIAAVYELAKQNKSKLIDFYNDYLAEPFIESEQGESVQEDVLYNRRYKFGPEGRAWQIPMKAILLTCAVDVQHNRLEAEVVAWAAEYESWGIIYKQFIGDPSKEDVWRQLDDFINQKFIHESGAEMRITATGIDSGFKAAEVYRFVRPRQPRRVYATKGSSVRGKPLISITSKSKLRQRKQVTLIVIGTDAAKDSIFSWMLVEDQGPRYMHFDESYGYDFFKMLTAEHAVTRYEKGRPYRTWVKKHTDIRNEALDLRCINYAMVELINPNWKALTASWNHRIEKLQAELPVAVAADKQEKPEPQPKKTGRRLINKGWR